MSVLKFFFHAVQFTEILRIVENLRREAVNHLDDDGLKRLNVIAQAVEK